jgi:hypothetical protein
MYLFFNVLYINCTICLRSKLNKFHDDDIYLLLVLYKFFFIFVIVLWIPSVMCLKFTRMFTKYVFPIISAVSSENGFFSSEKVKDSLNKVRNFFTK